MASKKHTHKYKKVIQKPSGRTIWACALPDCSHYTTPELVVGKKSICFTCDEEFVLTKALMSQRVRPSCAPCRFKNAKPRQENKELTSVLNTRVEDIVDKLLGE